jgi:predicted site-specific integrase-resolvase
MKLSEWAKIQGISYRTAWNMFQSGLLPNAYQLPTKTIIIQENKNNNKEYNVVYTRVSSSENKNNLDSQANRVIQFCNAKGWIVNEVVKEIGSGLNDSRNKLQKILKDKNVTRIIIEHKDRLTRFGYEYINTLFNGEIVIINEVMNNEEDLIQDFTSIITSFCARIYGQRRSKRKTEQLIRELKNGQVG